MVAKKIKGSGDDGLFERLIQMSVYPDHEHSDITDVAEQPFLKEKAKVIFEKVAQLDSPLEPITFSFDSDAQGIWDNWSINMLEKEKSVPELWKSVFGKYPSLCAKLAMTFHLIEEASKCKSDTFVPSQKISRRDITRAVFWIKYLITHHRRVAMLATKEVQYSSEAALESKLKELYPTFTRQVLSSKNWRHLNTKEMREQAIRVLLDKGYLKEQRAPRCFVVHPRYGNMSS